TNPDYLPSVRLPERVTATSDPEEALKGGEVVVFALPAQTLRGNLAALRRAIPPDATLVSLAKGIELGTTKRMSEVITEVAEVPLERVVVGCELGGAVKNVIALAYGIATAMRLGDNTKATLITRGLAETARLGVRLGADPLTFAGLAGLGDLV